MEAYYNIDTTEEAGIIALLRELVFQLQYYQCCEEEGIEGIEGIEDMVLDARAILDVADELEAL